MNDTTTQTAAPAAAKQKTVIDDMPSRRIFDSTESAMAAILAAQTEYSDFNSYPVVPVGMTDAGEFDPAIYTEGMKPTLSVLTQRGEGPGSSTVKAIVIYPQPDIDALLAAPGGKDWLKAIMEKELNHVAVRSLRKAETTDELGDAIESMPTTIGEYITSNRETSSGILETYNTLWPIVKKGMSQKYKSFALANLSKKELRKAMESASYAAAIYPHLEGRTNKAGEKESYFELAAKFGLALAAKEGLDSAIFQRMLDTRAEKTIDVVDDSEDDFDFEAMAEKLTAKEEAPAETQTDATTEAPAEQTTEPTA